MHPQGRALASPASPREEGDVATRRVTANGLQIFPFSSKGIGDRRWKGTAANIGGDSGEFIVYAYCDRHEPGLTRESDGVTIAQNSTGSATATCNPGSEAVSGGFARSNAAIYPYSSKRRGDRRWKASGWNDGSAPGAFTAVVYCDK
jgi:hypothetical protein